MVKPAQNLSTLTADFPSPAIWSRCPFFADNGAVINDRSLGIAFHDDFQDFPLTGTQTTQIGHGRYKVFNTGSGTISRVSAIGGTETFGGFLTNTLDTDNDSGSVAQAYPNYMLTGSKTTSGMLAFEICYAQNSIATNMAAGFFGLAEVEQWTLATAVPFNGSDSINNSASAIGFRIEEDGLGVVDTVVSDRATSFTNIGDTEGGTLAASVPQNFGFVYDPRETTNCITFYANNRPLATKYSRTSLTALTNLKANALGLILANCADSAGTSFASYVKWWRVAQMNPGMYW